MNKNIFEGKWDELKEKITRSWGKLTDDDLTQIKSDNQKFIGKLQKHYGYTKDEASRAVDDFLKNEGLESLKESADSAYSQIIQTGEQFIEGAKKKVEDNYYSVEEQVVKLVKQIKTNPIASVLVAGAIGFLLTSLMGKKK